MPECPIRDKLRLEVEKLNFGPFIEMIQEGDWDVVVNSHYLSTLAELAVRSVA
jgi:hypothetical protein